MECGIKSLIETKMTCPICRNLQDFSWGKNEVYLPVIDYVVDNNIYKMVYKIIDNNQNDLQYNNYMLERAILTENIKILEFLDDIDNEEYNDQPTQTSINLYSYILEHKKYKVMEYYAVNGNQITVNVLLLFAIQKTDLFAIMYLIYKFGADVHRENDGLNMLSYAVRTGSIEIITYLIHDCVMDVHFNDNSAIRESFLNGDYEIQKLCIDNVVDLDSIVINTEQYLYYKAHICNIRALIIENAVKKAGGEIFSILICNTCIYDKNVMELLEFFYKKLQSYDKKIKERNAVDFDVNTVLHND